MITIILHPSSNTAGLLLPPPFPLLPIPSSPLIRSSFMRYMQTVFTLPSSFSVLQWKRRTFSSWTWNLGAFNAKSQQILLQLIIAALQPIRFSFPFAAHMYITPAKENKENSNGLLVPLKTGVGYKWICCSCKYQLWPLTSVAEGGLSSCLFSKCNSPWDKSCWRVAVAPGDRENHLKVWS